MGALDFTKLYRNRSKASSIKDCMKIIHNLVNSTINDSPFISNFRYLSKMDRNLEKLLDYVYYTTSGNTMDKHLVRNVSEAIRNSEIDLVSFYLTFYEVTSIIGYLAISREGYEDLTEDQLGVLVIYDRLLRLIEIVKTYSENSEVIGINIETKKIKYKFTNDVMFDWFNGYFVGPEQRDVFKESIQIFRDLGNRIDSANDKADGLLNEFRLRNIVVDIINQKTKGFQFCLPEGISRISRELYKSKDSLTQPESFVSLNGEEFRNRVVLSNSNGNLLLVKKEFSSLTGLESILIKDVVIGQFCFIVISYKRDDGEDTILINPNFTSFGLSTDSFALGLVLNFYGINSYMFKDTTSCYEVISPYYWKYRDKGYVSSEDRLVKGVVSRKYKEVEIGAYLRKADSHSKLAEEIAKVYRINLPEGYTIVKEHIRHYGSTV